MNENISQQRKRKYKKDQMKILELKNRNILN